VVFSGCGTLNAFYSFGDAYALIASNNPAAVFGPNVTVPAIVMCHELTEKTVATFFNDLDLADKVRSLFNTTTPEEDLVAGVASALVFELQVLFHELGHAVDFLLLKDPNDSIKLANFTIPSPNTCTTPLCDTVANDFADWISAAVLVQVIQEKIKTDIDAAENFAKAWLIALDAWQTIVGTGGGVAHGLTQARQVNMLCYAYGAIPELRQADVDVLGNQLQTAISGQGVDPAGCETIYKRNDTSTTTLLGSFIN